MPALGSHHDGNESKVLQPQELLFQIANGNISNGRASVAGTVLAFGTDALIKSSGNLKRWGLLLSLISDDEIVLISSFIDQCWDSTCGCVLAKSATEVFEAEVYETEGRELEKGDSLGLGDSNWHQIACLLGRGYQSGAHGGIRRKQKTKFISFVACNIRDSQPMCTIISALAVYTLNAPALCGQKGGGW